MFEKLDGGQTRELQERCSENDELLPLNLQGSPDLMHFFFLAALEKYQGSEDIYRVTNWNRTTQDSYKVYNNRKFNILSHMTGFTPNVIYLVTCRACKAQYVGETGRSFSDRAKEHIRYAKLSYKVPTDRLEPEERHQLSEDARKLAPKERRQLLETFVYEGIWGADTDDILYHVEEAQRKKEEKRMKREEERRKREEYLNKKRNGQGSLVKKFRKTLKSIRKKDGEDKENKHEKSTEEEEKLLNPLIIVVDDCPLWEGIDGIVERLKAIHMKMFLAFKPHSEHATEKDMQILVNFLEAKPDCSAVVLRSQPSNVPLLKHILRNETGTALKLEAKSLSVSSVPAAIVPGPSVELINARNWKCSGRHLGYNCKGKGLCNKSVALVSSLSLAPLLEAAYQDAQNAPHSSSARLNVTDHRCFVLTSDEDLLASLQSLRDHCGVQFVHPKDFRGCEASIVITVDVSDDWLLEVISRSRTRLIIIDNLPNHEDLWKTMIAEQRVHICEGPSPSGVETYPEILLTLDETEQFLKIYWGCNGQVSSYLYQNLLLEAIKPYDYEGSSRQDLNPQKSHFKDVPLQAQHELYADEEGGIPGIRCQPGMTRPLESEKRPLKVGDLIQPLAQSFLHLPMHGKQSTPVFPPPRLPLSSIGDTRGMLAAMAPIERATLRPIVYYEFLQEHSARATANNICAAFKGNVVHYSTVSRWLKRLESGDTTFGDRPCSRRPSTVDDEALRNALNAKPNATTR
ncbi:unnamed protein product [Darwinula stevensoni]|uniref:Mos1 transposase HTH domain-containing protein n=1 Tax=Darwinula stevensoni TaxID=69355 RepID=A0A7R9FQB9_9CRUS|nr:unnamed protein product [Darwinula stevensoni]CAG0899459.1 unnamed protein product [Darwinula stevensoni]